MGDKARPTFIGATIFRMPERKTLSHALREDFDLGGGTGGSVSAAELRGDGGNEILVVTNLGNFIEDVPITMFFDNLFFGDLLFAILNFYDDLFVTILHLIIFHDAQPLHTF